MQKSKIKVLISVLLILVLATSYCFATSNSEETPLVTTLEETAEDSNTTRENETNTDSNKKILSSNDIYICDSRVNISQLVDGNAFIIGDDVTISGEVGGDVFVIANKLTIDGSYIYNSVFAIANEININGVVYDVYSSCRTFNLQENGYIYRDLKLIADNVNISGRVKRNAYRTRILYRSRGVKACSGCKRRSCRGNKKFHQKYDPAETGKRRRSYKYDQISFP